MTRAHCPLWMCSQGGRPVQKPPHFIAASVGTRVRNHRTRWDQQRKQWEYAVKSAKRVPAKVPRKFESNVLSLSVGNKVKYYPRTGKVSKKRAQACSGTVLGFLHNFVIINPERGKCEVAAVLAQEILEVKE